MHSFLSQLFGSLFVIHAGLQSLSEQIKMPLSACFIYLLENDQTELFPAIEVSALLLFCKKNVDRPVASFGLPVTASIATRSSVILAWIHVLLCNSLFTGINKRECLLHHPLGISGIKKKLFFSTLDCLSFSSWFFFLSNINRNWFLSCSTMQSFEGGFFFFFHNVTWWQWCCQEWFPKEMGGLRMLVGCGGPCSTVWWVSSKHTCLCLGSDHVSGDHARAY